MANTSSGIPTPQASPGQIGVLDIESGIADSLYQAATAAAPAAGAAIATIAAPPAGIYEVWAQVGFIAGAPTAALDAINVTLRKGATIISNGAVVAAPNLNLAQPFAGPFRVTLDGATNLNLSATANATAGVTYVGAILAKRVG